MQHTKFSLTQPQSGNILFIYMETLLLNKHWKHWSLAVKNLCSDADVFKRPDSHTPFASPKPLFHLLAWFRPRKITVLQAELPQPKNSQVTGSWQPPMHRQCDHTSPVSLGRQAKNTAFALITKKNFSSEL